MTREPRGEVSRARSFDPFVMYEGGSPWNGYPEDFDFTNTPHPFDRAGDSSAYGDHEPWDSCYGCGQREFSPIHERPA